MSQLARSVTAAVVGGAVVLLLTVSLRPWPVVATTPGATTDTTHTITVTSTGTVTLVPDVARINLGVTVTQPTVEAARAEAARVMTAIIAAARGKGVAEKDIQTSGISLSPQYQSCSAGCPDQGKIVGYTMNEQVQVTVRDLDKAGSIIDAATAAGATNVNGISFEAADPDAAADQARADAIRTARTKADAMAKVAGVSVVGVVSIEESSGSTPVPYRAAQAFAADAPTTPVSPGTTEVSAAVTVVYEIG